MARTRLQYTFEIFDTPEQAQAFCDQENKRYPWRKNKAHTSPWVSRDGKEHKTLAFYYR